jgi:glycosyltransferase involved in cell wall biosynthesis
MILSILVPFVEQHRECFNELCKALVKQYSGTDVEMVYDDDEYASTGEKRNRLLNKASGKYIVFIDADDEVTDCYIDEILKGAESDCDCMGIKGWMTTDGTSRIDWELSKDFQNDTIIRNGKRFYIRKTNHIAPVKRELALQTMFPDKSNAEDKDYSDRLNHLLKTEYKIEPLMYHYKYQTKNKTYR